MIVPEHPLPHLGPPPHHARAPSTPRPTPPMPIRHPSPARSHHCAYGIKIAIATFRIINEVLISTAQIMKVKRNTKVEKIGRFLWLHRVKWNELE